MQQLISPNRLNLDPLLFLPLFHTSFHFSSQRFVMSRDEVRAFLNVHKIMAISTDIYLLYLDYLLIFEWHKYTNTAGDKCCLFDKKHFQNNCLRLFSYWFPKMCFILENYSGCLQTLLRFRGNQFILHIQNKRYTIANHKHFQVTQQKVRISLP